MAIGITYLETHDPKPLNSVMFFDMDGNGHSTVFDGVAWLRDETGVRDMCILEAPGEAGVYVADVNMDQLREYRAHEVMGNNFRHPGTYGCDSW
ncbi:hypothetical protein SAMN02910264_02026 [Ruminococcaceae bacterium YAD3003]|nr:hypothetical protein SAMN02910264_02026 [Ruminococcaceae bacterium YAD3003]